MTGDDDGSTAPAAGHPPLLGYDGDRVRHRRPAANAFHSLASDLDGAVTVTPLFTAPQPQGQHDRRDPDASRAAVA